MNASPTHRFLLAAGVLSKVWLPRRRLSNCRRIGALGLALALCVGAPAGPALAGDPVAGKEVYESNCVPCHGFGGHATFYRAPSFAKGEHLEKPDAELLRSVRDGLSLMPPWGATLSERQILDAIAYVRTLAPR